MITDYILDIKEYYATNKQLKNKNNMLIQEVKKLKDEIQGYKNIAQMPLKNNYSKDKENIFYLETIEERLVHYGEKIYWEFILSTNRDAVYSYLRDIFEIINILKKIHNNQFVTIEYKKIKNQ